MGTLRNFLAFARTYAGPAELLKRLGETLLGYILYPIFVHDREKGGSCHLDYQQKGSSKYDARVGIGSIFQMEYKRPLALSNSRYLCIHESL